MSVELFQAYSLCYYLVLVGGALKVSPQVRLGTSERRATSRLWHSGWSCVEH